MDITNLVVSSLLQARLKQRAEVFGPRLQQCPVSHELLFLHDYGDIGVFSLGEKLEKVSVEIRIATRRGDGFVDLGFSDEESGAFKTKLIIGEGKVIQIKELRRSPTHAPLEKFLFESK